MKSVFKCFVFSFLVLSIFQVNAQQVVLKDEQLKSAKVNILHNLESDVNGIVESTLFGIMLMKKYYPDQDYSQMKNEVYLLSSEGNTAEIRVKAQLTAMYLDFTSWFSDVDFADKDNPHKYFAKISERIQTNLLTSN